MISFTLGRVLLVEAALMVPAVICGIIYGEQEINAFFIPIVFSAVLGLIISRKKPENTVIYAREGFFIVAMSWVILSLIGSLPLFLCGKGIPIWDSIFETVSGFTTTGATVITNVEALPHCILFWRSFTHWIGGMGVLVFVLAIVPMAGDRSLHIMRAEVPGPTVGKLVPKMHETAKILSGVYSI